MSDTLRKAVIKLASENPSLRRHLVPILRKTAGCEKLPEGPMRDNCEKKKDEKEDDKKDDKKDEDNKASRRLAEIHRILGI